jgi:ribosomal protein L35
MKLKKLISKRLKVTKNGKILSRAPGFNHFNSKQSRVKQLGGKKLRAFVMTNKEKSRFLPGLVKIAK